MSDVLVEESYLSNIADSIRSKLGVNTTYTPAEMADAINSIPSGGGGSLAYDYRQVEITITNSIGASQFEYYGVWAYKSEFVQFPQEDEYFPLADFKELNGSFTVFVPPDSWGISIDCIGGSPDGIDWGSDVITVSGNLTYSGIADPGFSIKVDGNGTVTINGIDFDP